MRGGPERTRTASQHSGYHDAKVTRESMRGSDDRRYPVKLAVSDGGGCFGVGLATPYRLAL